jgi:hypothetical protein
MHDITGNNWHQRNSEDSFEDKFGRHTIKIFNRFATKYCYTGDVTRNTESTAV